MAKKTAKLHLILLCTLSVVVSMAVPHHHHNQDRVICLGCESHPLEDHGCACCNSGEPTAESDCCSLKSNLVTNPDESRNKSKCCSGDAALDFHEYDFFTAVPCLPEIFNFSIPLPQSIRSGDCFSFHFYHTVLTEGHIGFRAPPAV